MKKYNCVLTALLIFFASTLWSVAVSPAPAWAAFSGGAGTEADPYIVTTPEELDAVREDLAAHYKLGSDIDLSAYLAKWGAEGWLPIGTYAAPFTGGFDGNKKKIVGLWINRSTTDYVGLFGVAVYAGTNVTIKDLGVEIAAAGVKGNSSVGGLVGYQINGSVANCYATGSISGKNYVGGLVGNSHDSCITNCYATGNASVVDYVVGGLVGNQYNSSITDCYANVTVSGAGDFSSDFGGLVGVSNGSIINCYATGIVGDDEVGKHVGGLVGFQTGSIINSYATGVVNGYEHVGGLVGWQHDGNIANSHAIGNVRGFVTLGGLVGGTNESTSITNCYATGNVRCSGGEFGGLAGRSSSNITNCYATGNVSGSNTGPLGGLVGWNADKGSITNCYATGNVSGITSATTANFIGGLVGLNSGAITNSYATGVTRGWHFVGGLVGHQFNGSIANCYAAGNVTFIGPIGDTFTFNHYAGGLVGTQWEGVNTENSYRYVYLTINGWVIPANHPDSATNKKHGGVVYASGLKIQKTYTDNGWLFHDSVSGSSRLLSDSDPEYLWYWDDRGFPKLNLGTEDSPFVFATVESVTVSPTKVEVRKGSSQAFTAAVNGTNNPSQSVTWSVEGGTSTSISDDGLLIVGAGEMEKTLTVRAESVEDDGKSDTVVVTVTDNPVTSYKLTVNAADNGMVSVTEGDYPVGATLSVTAIANPGYIFTKWTANGITLANDKENPAEFIMPANAVTLTASFEEEPPSVTAVNVNPPSASVSKGQSQHFTAVVKGTNNTNLAVTWNVEGGMSSSISADGLLTVGANETANALIVRATSVADTEKSGTATVTVTEAKVNLKVSFQGRPESGPANVENLTVKWIRGGAVLGAGETVTTKEGGEAQIDLP